MAIRANIRVREEMLRAGLTQAALAKLLETSSASVSVMLRYELAEKEQDDIIKIIRAFVKRKEKEAE